VTVPFPSRSRQIGLRCAAACLTIAAALAALPQHAEAAAAGYPPSRAENPCAFLFSCQTTAIQVMHPKNDVLVLYSTWSKAANKPAPWAAYTVSCSDGTMLSRTVSPSLQGSYFTIDRDPGNLASVTCTASVTLPAGYPTTASFHVYNPGYPPPYDYGYDSVEFDS